jgi:uncharacterized membrane protein HdeD (DUF308 family)
MSLGTETPLSDPITDELRMIGHRWGHFLVLGVVLIILGTLAIIFSCIASMAITLTFGILLLAGGLVQIVTSFWASKWSGFFLELFLGVLYLVAGGFMIRHPVAAAAGITLVLAVSFVAGGIMRIAFAIAHRGTGDGWVLLNGIITLILGIMIWSRWPWDSLWIIGLFVGIDLIFLGWTWVMLGSAVKPRPARI